MHAVFLHLADNSVLLLFILLGLGMGIGHIKIRKVGLGAAAVLFVGIAVAAWSARSGVELTIPHDIGILGLAVFTFAIGISSGANFFHVMKTATGPILVMLAAFVLAAITAVILGRALGMPTPMIAGAFAGAVTNTPSLAAAGNAAQLAGYDAPQATATVGYAVAYLYGVVGMLAFCLLALRHRQTDDDAAPPLVNRTIRVERTDAPTIAELLKEINEDLSFSRHAHGSQEPITLADEDHQLRHHDLVTVVGSEDAVRHAVEALGHDSSHSLIEDRRYLDFRRITVSDSALVGRSIGQLDLEHRFGATVSRVRRGDVDMVATNDLVLQLGDRVRVVAASERMKEISRFFGDSTRGLTALNPIALGLGMALGIYIGEFEIFTPSGATFSIGSAAGTLIVGLLFGRIGRIGGFVTTMPFTTAQVLAEFGLLIFLARAGVTAGGQIEAAFTSGDWWRILLLGFVVTTMVGGGVYLAMRKLFHMGGTRLAGLIGGVQTQPAVLAFANERTNADPRVAIGYAMVYPVAMIAKIFIAQFMGGL